MKSVSFQSSTQWLQCAFEFCFFFLISDVTYFTVICCEGGQFPVNHTMVSCMLLSYFSFFTIYNLTYSTVICCEECKFPVIDTLVSCVLLSYLSFFMISDLISTVICYEACKIPVIEILSFVLYDL